MMNLSPRFGAFALMLALAGCKADEKPTTWEILEGSAELTMSAALHPTTRASLATYGSRTGGITIHADSTTTGWIRIAAGDTVQLDGVVTKEGNDWFITFDDLVPAEYEVITDGDFPDSFGLISTTILNSDVTGDAVPEQHRIYWQFER
jgi:hypothetical protein